MKSLLLCFGVLLACLGCNNSPVPLPAQVTAPRPTPRVFSEADVTKAQEEITHEYQNKGFEVEQVSLIKDSYRMLVNIFQIRQWYKNFPLI